MKQKEPQRGKRETKEDLESPNMEYEYVGKNKTFIFYKLEVINNYLSLWMFNMFAVDQSNYFFIGTTNGVSLIAQYCFRIIKDSITFLESVRK